MEISDFSRISFFGFRARRRRCGTLQNSDLARGAVEMEGEGAVGEARGGVYDDDDVVICGPTVPNPNFTEDKAAATRAYELAAAAALTAANALRVFVEEEANAAKAEYVAAKAAKQVAEAEKKAAMSAVDETRTKTGDRYMRLVVAKEVAVAASAQAERARAQSFSKWQTAKTRMSALEADAKETKAAQKAARKELERFTDRLSKGMQDVAPCPGVSVHPSSFCILILDDLRHRHATNLTTLLRAYSAVTSTCESKGKMPTATRNWNAAATGACSPPSI